MSVDDLKLLEELENQADLKAAFKARKEKGSISLERIELRLAASLGPPSADFTTAFAFASIFPPYRFTPGLARVQP